MSREPDIVLVKAAAEGNVESFTELAARYYTPMVAIAHSITGDRDLAEDAAQQCFARAAVKLSQLKNYEKFAGWLAAICRNEAKDIARLENNHRNSEKFSEIKIESKDNDSSEVVKNALSKLSNSSREVIYLRYYDGLSYDQISEVLGISEQAINGRLRRAKKKLAQTLKREGFKQV
ncbi:MAG: sigma-70 family RNA polymerase sigma factor [Sedimentisphaerales bacterium]|nr:sigma-70 family RNA polymerase sigma factor [Sedimentisphaerales bacterium]